MPVLPTAALVNPVRSSRPFALLAALAGLAMAAGFGGCGGDVAAGRSEEAAQGDGRHPLVGTVLAVHRDRGALLVDHEEIPGVMPRMTMEFKASPGDLAVAREGLVIRAVMFQSADGFHLEQIWPAGQTGDRIVSEAARALRRDTVTRGRSAFREVGENLPGFALYDQNGTVVQASRFRGRQIVLNFIFTRCPDPKMCPATVAKMIQLQAIAREAGVANLELVTITLDPEFDTPGVLHGFAESHGIDTSNFSLLTGPEGAIKDLMAQLGILAFQEGPILKHTLATILVDESGQIVHRVDGSQWLPSDFAGRLRRSPEGSS
jgi:protein SCO1